MTESQSVALLKVYHPNKSGIPTEMFARKNDSDIGLTHYKHARGSWQVGITNFWIRKRGIITSFLATLILGGTPWWAEYLPPDWGISKILKFPAEITFAVGPLFAVLGSAAAAFTVLLIFVVRANAIKSLERKEAFHKLSHQLRDAFSELLSRTGRKKSKHDPEHERKHLLESSNRIASCIVEYFQKISRRNCIGCVIRLAQQDPKDATRGIEYASVGRAGAIDATRSQTSEGIPANEGLPKLFKSPEFACHGVVYIHSIEIACAKLIYKQTGNERQFPDDYNCLMAIPMNAWNGHRWDLIGILTITGRSKKHLLRVQNVDIAKAIGDLLALHYSASIARLATSDRLPNSFTQEHSA